jgi:hypothetical protein
MISPMNALLLLLSLGSAVHAQSSTVSGTASATVYILLRTEMAEFQQTNRDGERVTMTGAVVAAVSLAPSQSSPSQGRRNSRD